jgi:hypothetical protein
MARTCTICTHAERAEIDAAIVRNDAFRRIASQYSVSEAAVRRHKAEHLPALLVKAKDAEDVAAADTLLDQIVELKKLAMHFLAKASQAGDYRTALAGIREARSCLETLAEIEGELDRRPVINVIASPAWVELRSVLLTALDPFPHARLAAAEAVAALEVRHAA